MIGMPLRIGTRVETYPRDSRDDCWDTHLAHTGRITGEDDGLYIVTLDKPVVVYDVTRYPAHRRTPTTDTRRAFALSAACFRVVDQRAQRA